jgi:hypothetical protein
LLLRLIRIHEFLCEGCNLQFRAFSLLSPRSRRRKGKNSKSRAQGDARLIEPTPVPQINIVEPAPVPRKNPHANPLLAQATSTGAAGANSPLSSPVRSASSDSKPTIKAQWQMPAGALEEFEMRRQSHRSHQICPQCGKSDTERRRRKLWEKVAFAFTSIRAYRCRICGERFYARRKPKTEA